MLACVRTMGNRGKEKFREKRKYLHHTTKLNGGGRYKQDQRKKGLGFWGGFWGGVGNHRDRDILRCKCGMLKNCGDFLDKCIGLSWGDGGGGQRSI